MWEVLLRVEEHGTKFERDLVTRMYLTVCVSVSVSVHTWVLDLLEVQAFAGGLAFYMDTMMGTKSL